MLKGGAYALAVCVVGFVLYGVFAALPWERYSGNQYLFRFQQIVIRPDPGLVKRAAMADGRLWVLSQAGELWTIQEEVSGAEKRPTPERVIDICARDGQLTALTAPRLYSTAWTLRRWTGAGWTTLATLDEHGSALAALACDTGGVIVLTANRLITFRDNGRTEVALSQRVPGAVIGAYLVTEDMIFVGVNAGEFGGGMMRVRRRDGATTQIEDNSWGDCEGPLGGCDNVDSIVPSPWTPGCVATAIGRFGIGYYGGQGRIVEVCGERVIPRYFRPYCLDQPDPPPAPGREPYCTVSFFNLFPMGDKLQAIGSDGVHLIDRTGAGQRSPIPEFKPYGPFGVSFAAPGYVLVIGDEARWRSDKKGRPLLALR